MQLFSSIDNRFRLFFGLQFAGIGVFFAYIALYLGTLDLTGSQVGILLALVPFVAFLVQPIWGVANDITHQHRRMLVIACLGVVLSMVGMASTRQFGWILLFTILHAVMMSPTHILVTTLALEHLNRQSNGVGFGSLRLWGSIGFAIGTFVIGALLIDQGDVWWIMPIYGFGNLLLALVAWSLPDADVHGQVNWRDALTLLQRQRVLAWFLIGSLFIGTTHGIVNNYLSVYMTDINAAGWIIGVALAISAIGEVPLMARAQQAIDRWGIRPILILGATMLPIRWFLYIFIEQPLLVLPTQILHSVGMVALLVVGILYIDRLLEPKWRTSGQALYAAFLTGIGPGIGLYAAGIIYSSYGIKSVWLFSTITASIGILIIAFAVYRHPDS